jgi:hypothetical protein
MTTIKIYFKRAPFYNALIRSLIPGAGLLRCSRYNLASLFLRLRCLSSYMRSRIAGIFLGIALAATCWGHAPVRVESGIVVSESGTPLPAVEVYGTKWTCCPATVKSTMTGPGGKFSLVEPGPVLHFRRSGLQPFSLVIGKDRLLRVVMKNQQPTIWSIPTCGSKEPLRFGQTFLFLRQAGEPLAKGQDDDYTRFEVKGRDGGGLDSWFGPTASTVDASEEFFVESESFSERFVEVSGFGLVGIDAQGLSTSGKHWRWLGLQYAIDQSGKSLVGPVWHWPRMTATDMIRYDNATDAEATEFNKIIDSACLQSR